MFAMNANSKNRGTNMSEIVEKVELILLDQIEVNPKWNTRSNLAEYSGGPDGKNGLDGLVTSIKMRGQDDPVYVRPNTREGAKKPFFLVSGNRRFEAIRRIAAEKNDKAPTIKAIVRKMTDLEAFELNVRENTAREDLGGADLAFGVGRIISAYKADKKEITQQQLADMLGYSQGYMNKIEKIALFLRVEILEKWRNEMTKLTVDQIHAIAKAPHNEQMNMYNKLVRGKAENEAENGKGRASIEPQKRAAARYATIIGTLVRHGHLDEVDVDTFFDETLPLVVKLKKGKDDLKKSDVNRCVKAAKDAYTSAVVDSGEEEEEAPKKKEEEAPKKKGGRGEARAEN